MSKALIGYSGFVGQNLLSQQDFEHLFNSSNIDTIRGQRFGQVYCAGAPAVKWLANKEPDNDKRILDRLFANLSAVETDKFILISTVDVYPHPVEVDEDTDIDPAACHPYGLHRLQLEQRLAQRFDTLVVRLPGLFGPGIKKNVIYDFLNANNIEQINPRGVFQFYDLKHLSQDINTALQHGLSVVNISCEPVSVAEVARVCLGREFENDVDSPAARYDYRSRHASLYGGANGYMYNRRQVLDDLAEFVSSYETAG